MGDVIPREADGRFLRGKPPGPGRPRGSRSKLSEEFIANLLTDWSANGADAIERLRQEDVATYLKIIASICRVARVEIAEAAPDDEFAHVRSREDLYARAVGRWLSNCSGG